MKEMKDESNTPDESNETGKTLLESLKDKLRDYTQQQQWWEARCNALCDQIQTEKKRLQEKAKRLACRKCNATKFYVTRQDDDMIFECAMCRCRWSLEGFLM